METGKYYSQISKTISILVLNYELIHDTMNYKNVYHFCDLQTKSVFSDKLEIITLELPKIPTDEAVGEKEKRLISWLEFLKVEKKMEAAQVIEKYPYLQKAYDKIQELSRDSASNVEYTERLISYFDEIGRLTNEDRLREEITQQSEEIKKLKEDAENAKRIVAKKALNEGLDIPLIVKISGLSEEEINNL